MDNLHDNQTKTNEHQLLMREVAVIARRSHSRYAKGEADRLLTLEKEQLVARLLIEKDAKNQAYYFILERGHFDEFYTYCESESAG